MYKKYIIEAREKAGGQLKFDCEQPPVKDYSENQIFDLYWKLSGDKSDSVGKDKIAEYFASKNWFVRVKTW